ncbi:MAG: NAD-dependent protein deacylase [Clostridia bacterium]|nr:NAD-dependent protein deacylase [Clostridia bacterium]
MNPIEKKVREAKHPVALTGAGISAPSGIPTFQGTWKNQPIRDFLTREYAENDPIGFFELFVDMVKWCDKEPNPAHKALAMLDIPVITQNIDGLHEKAGTKTVYPLHGTLHTVHCTACGKKRSSKEFAAELKELYDEGDRQKIMEGLRCPECGGWIDTDVVLYGDSIHHLYDAMRLSEQADLMLVIGTSLITYPAAALPQIAKNGGAEIILINDDCVKALEGICK